MHTPLTGRLVSSFSELHDALERYRRGRYLFRGHSSVEWRLLPKAGRPPFTGTSDAQIFKAWKRRAIELVDVRPSSDWDWLALAQHHGLATRLLDWSTNPLAAAFFAVAEPHAEDAVIYAYRPRCMVRTDDIQPMEYHGVVQFKPSAVARRISRQGGHFTVHGPPTLPLDEALREGEELERIVISKKYRSALLFELDHYGINKLSLFHDLDGLSEYLNWTTINREHWNGVIEVTSEPSGVS